LEQEGLTIPDIVRGITTAAAGSVEGSIRQWRTKGYKLEEIPSWGEDDITTSGPPRLAPNHLIQPPMIIQTENCSRRWTIPISMMELLLAGALL
jgi:hypothetical protein